jgi:hypothetical protein
MKKKTNTNRNKAIAVGAGLAAVAAAAAGVYMMTGKNAKNRKKVMKWAGDLEKDVVTELNKAGKATKATYAKIVDSAAANYKGLKEVSGPDLAIVANELKSSWDTISAELQNASKVVKKVVPKAAKNITKKVAKVNKAIAKKSAKKSVKKVVKKAAPKKVAPKKAPKKVTKKTTKRRR